MARPYDMTKWMELDIADLFAQMADLSTEEVGMVILLRAYYYKNYGEVPDDDERLAKVCRLTVERFREHRPMLLDRFFTVKAGRWLSAYMDELIDRALKFADRNRARAKNAANARWSKASDSAGGTSNS